MRRFYVSHVGQRISNVPWPLSTAIEHIVSTNHGSRAPGSEVWALTLHHENVPSQMSKPDGYTVHGDRVHDNLARLDIGTLPNLASYDRRTYG